MLGAVREQGNEAGRILAGDDVVVGRWDLRWLAEWGDFFPVSSSFGTHNSITRNDSSYPMSSFFPLNPTCFLQGECEQMRRRVCFIHLGSTRFHNLIYA